jgi:hypothetical protein
MNEYEDPREIIIEAFEAGTYGIERLEPIIMAAEIEHAKLVDFWVMGEKHDAVGGTIRVQLGEDADAVGAVVSTLVGAYRSLPLSLTINVAPHNPSADVGFTTVKPFLWHPGQPSLDALRQGR